RRPVCDQPSQGPRQVGRVQVGGGVGRAGRALASGEAGGELLGHSFAHAGGEAGAALGAEHRAVEGGVRRDVLEEFAEGGGGAVGRGGQGADGGGAGRLGERGLHRVGEQLVDVAVVGVDRGAVDTGRAGDRGDAEG